MAHTSCTKERTNSHLQYVQPVQRAQDANSTYTHFHTFYNERQNSCFFDAVNRTVEVVTHQNDHWPFAYCIFLSNEHMTNDMTTQATDWGSALLKVSQKESPANHRAMLQPVISHYFTAPSLLWFPSSDCARRLTAAMLLHPQLEGTSITGSHITLDKWLMCFFLNHEISTHWPFYWLHLYSLMGSNTAALLWILHLTRFWFQKADNSKTCQGGHIVLVSMSHHI